MFYFWNESSASNISIRLSDIHLFYYEFCLIIEAANVKDFALSTPCTHLDMISLERVLFRFFMHHLLCSE